MQASKYLIFDFDGVLGDTWDVTLEINIKMKSDLTPHEVEERMMKYFNSKPWHAKSSEAQVSEAELARKYEWTATFGSLMLERTFQLFNQFVEEIKLIEDKVVAVVSSGSQIYVLPALAEANLGQTHVLAYENHHSKEEKVEIVCKDWGIEPSEAYYFTDTLADVYELRDLIAEDKLIGVAWGFCGYDSLATELKPEHILKNPQDIHQLFL